MTQVTAAQHNLFATALQRPGYTASGRPATPPGHTAPDPATDTRSR